ncbi:acyl-homoserine-lactone synthase [Pseudohalocynthiibacter aestuariivivens]|uniref:Acyl-homoserine-lactone synthase n=1 Tax=Pseudohalocynthiibacter aestuariivivens TaxID=1591409 RepID=A0ABV5JGL8_9RHOB|nr:acyl-homoserine-lactone synthase [Pseudohalocynthiibacter aestuariivivens]MBS9718970.1 hypothetical protein [Pseudohalocynthiibacter aestuariivivens]
MTARAKITVVQFPDGIGNWNLVYRFFRLRKRVFIDQMNWSLDQYDRLEFEQYDTLGATYIIAHEGQDILGGARLIRTDAKQPQSNGKVQYSYMIRDAYLGLLPGLPSNLCDGEPPTDEKTWELTRFVSAENAHVGERILREACEFLKSVGASECLFLGPPTFLRLAKRMGFSPKKMGKIVGNKDGRFLAFTCPIVGDGEMSDAEIIRRLQEIVSEKNSVQRRVLLLRLAETDVPLRLAELTEKAFLSVHS